MTKILGLCVFFLFAVTTLTPQDMSGDSLLNSCELVVKKMDNPHHSENSFESYRDGYCRGMVEGVSDTSPKICPGGNVTFGQEFRVVVKYLQDHPEELHLPNTALVEKALAKAFPCQK